MDMQVSALFDAGRPSVLEGTRLADAFRYWQGHSGAEYLFRIVSLRDLSETQGHVVIVARRDANSRREALWVGMGGTLDAFADIAAAKARGANEVHIHALAETVAARGEVIDDLRAAAMLDFSATHTITLPAAA